MNTDVCTHLDESGASTQVDRLAVFAGTNELYYLEHDATRPFPIEDEAFEWVFSERFIEHLSLAQGIAWLREVNRLLKPGGFIRLSTPDISVYARAYNDLSGKFFFEHERRLRELRVQDVRHHPAWMINQIFRYWGHQWLYDFDENCLAAESASFQRQAVQRRAFRQGRSASVAALDLEIRNDESLYVETSKLPCSS